jgi:hypothetical protein
MVARKRFAGCTSGSGLGLDFLPQKAVVQRLFYPFLAAATPLLRGTVATGLQLAKRSPEPDLD